MLLWGQRTRTPPSGWRYLWRAIYIQNAHRIAQILSPAEALKSDTTVTTR
jgi:hypothetical protein